MSGNTKDFIFFTYSWVKNANIYFKSFEKSGYTCDFVDEKTVHEFIPSCDYRCVVLYLHEGSTLPKTEYLINNYFKDSVLIQHDDTDHEHVQRWSTRSPDMIMQREYTKDTINPYQCPIYPFHFPIPSVYDNSVKDKIYDVCFMASMTNPRRRPFVEKLIGLAKTSMSDLVWYIDVKPINGKTPNYSEILNKSKIGIHYFGNSYDSIRIWEIASTKTALLMPKMKNLSVSEDYMPFTEYAVLDDDYSNLEESIRSLLKDDSYQIQAQKTQIEYNNNHCPEKCVEYYQDKVLGFLGWKDE